MHKHKSVKTTVAAVDIDKDAEGVEAMAQVDSFLAQIVCTSVPFLPLAEARKGTDELYDHALTCPNCGKAFPGGVEQIERHRKLSHRMLDILVQMQTILQEAEALNTEVFHPGTETRQ